MKQKNIHFVLQSGSIVTTDILPNVPHDYEPTAGDVEAVEENYYSQFGQTAIVVNIFSVIASDKSVF